MATKKRQEEEETSDLISEETPRNLWDRSGESPNRIVYRRKIGRNQPERGTRPIVL